MAVAAYCHIDEIWSADGVCFVNPEHEMSDLLPDGWNCSPATSPGPTDTDSATAQSFGVSGA